MQMQNVNPYNKSTYPVGYSVLPLANTKMTTPPSLSNYGPVVELARPGFPMLPVPLLKMFLKGKSVPNVAGTLSKTKTMKNVAGVVLKQSSLEQDVFDAGLKGVKGDNPITLPGWSQNTCATNQAPNGNWMGWRVATPYSTACGFGTGDVAGANSGITTLHNALMFSETPTRSSSACLWQLNNQNSQFGSGKRRKYSYMRSNTVPLGKPRHYVNVRRANIPNMEGSPKMSALPRPRGRSALKPYEKVATQVVVENDGSGGAVIVGPPVKVIHKEVFTPGLKEKKSKKLLGFALIGAYHKLTELNDFFDALADAIPGKPCAGLPGFLKMVCVVKNWDNIDPAKAAINVLLNELEDKLVARLQNKLRGALESAGGPNATQVQQFLRTLRTL